MNTSIIGDSSLRGGGAPGVPEKWRASIRKALRDATEALDAIEALPGVERGYQREFERVERAKRPPTTEERIAALEKGATAEDVESVTTTRSFEEVGPSPAATDAYRKLQAAMQRLEQLNEGP